MRIEHEGAGYEKYRVLIPEHRVEDTVGKLKRLSSRAVKLNMPAFDIEVGEPEVHKKLAGNGDPYDTVNTSVVPITVVGGVPRLKGWQFVAKIEHDDDVNEVLGFGAQKLVDDDPAMFEKLTQCEPDCQHCNVKRNRNTTYLFKSETNPQELIQVGSSCIDDFSGHKNPVDLLRMANQFVSVMGELADPDEMGVGGSGSRLYDMERILAVASSVVRADGGWVSRDSAGSSGCSVDWVTSVMLDPKMQRKLVTEGDERKGTEIFNWLTSDAFEVGTDIYRSNLAGMAARGYVPAKKIGLAGSAVATYARDMQKLKQQKERNDKYESVAIGEPDKKISRTVLLEKKVPIENQWGMNVLHIFKDVETNAKMTWFNSGSGKFLEGRQYNISGRVKKHETRNGLLETKLTRVSSPDLALHGKITPELDAKPFIKKLKKLETVNALDANSENLIHVASHVHRFYGVPKDVLYELIDMGADPSVVSHRDGNNAFDYWVDAQDEELIELGLKRWPELAFRWDDKMLADYDLIDKPWSQEFRRVRDSVVTNESQEVNSKEGAEATLLELRKEQPKVSEELDLDFDDEDDDQALRLA